MTCVCSNSYIFIFHLVRAEGLELKTNQCTELGSLSQAAENMYQKSSSNTAQKELRFDLGIYTQNSFTKNKSPS